MAEADSRSKQLNAEGESRAKELMGQGEARAKELVGKAEAMRVASLGIAEATGLYQKLKAYGDPRIYAMQQIGENFSKSARHLVPGESSHDGRRQQRKFERNRGRKRRERASASALNLLFTMMAEASASPVGHDARSMEELERFADEVTKSAGRSRRRE